MICGNKCLSHTTRKKKFFLNFSSKKRTSLSKKRIRKNIWKKKTYFSIVKSYCLAKLRSFSSGKEYPKPKGFSAQQTNK